MTEAKPRKPTGLLGFGRATVKEVLLKRLSAASLSW